MKSELPPHLRVYSRPLVGRHGCRATSEKTEIFAGNTFPPPPLLAAYFSHRRAPRVRDASEKLPRAMSLRKSILRFQEYFPSTTGKRTSITRSSKMVYCCCRFVSRSIAVPRWNLITEATLGFRIVRDPRGSRGMPGTR